MEYKNTKTGVTFSSPFIISGGDWVEANHENVVTVKEVVPVVVEAAPVEKEEKIGADDSENVTKKEIMQELDALGIKYDPRSKKQELYDLMIGK